MERVIFDVYSLYTSPSLSPESSVLVLPFFTDVSQRICFSLEHECIVYSGSEIYPENMFRVVNEGEMLRDLHVKHCYSHFITDNNLKGRLYKSYILIKIIHPSLGNSNILVKINEFFLSTDITSVVTDQQGPPFMIFIILLSITFQLLI